jgi:carbon storage regulator
MLVLARKKGERIVVGDDLVTITVVRCGRDEVRIGIDAPRELSIHREEILQRIVNKRRSSKEE